MLTLQPTPIVRAAEQAIARHKKVRQVPAVLRAGLDETAEAFAQRCATVRVGRVRRILAAVPYGFAVPTGVQAVEFPAKLFKLLHPDTPSRYRVASGGRGSGKSHAIAAEVVLRMLSSRLRILCAREIQRSLRESVHHLLSEKIEQLGLAAFFEINDREIRCITTGSEIIFAGLMMNVQQLKSLEGVGLCWIEEAESVSQRSFEILTPTIRAAGSEIWASCNPDDPDAPVQGFIEGERPDTRHEHVTFGDNPWFPAELEGERTYLQRVDDDAYRHVWLGECRTHSDAQVFKGKYTVEAFEPYLFGWDGPYLGADWGFIDPTTLVKAWVYEQTLYIEHEAYGLGCDLDRVTALFDSVPRARDYVIRADCSRPETIAFMQTHGYPRITACEKWAGGFVEDGIAHIRSYERVVIHPRCTQTAQEFRLYSYKVDRLTGDVLPDLKSGNDHCVDALRYALEPLIRKQGTWAWGSI
jgi:phage terminase large subunit